jgi:hypothetical protein
MLPQARLADDPKPAQPDRPVAGDRPYLRPMEPPGLGAPVWRLLAVVLLGGLGGLYYWHKNQGLPPSQPQVRAETSPAPPFAGPAPAVQHLPESLDPQSLPTLAESDAGIWAALQSLFHGRSLVQLAYSDQIIRRIVATVDNLPRKSAPVRMMPLKPAPGGMKVVRSGVTHVIAPANAVRYGAYVRLAQAVDTRRLVDLYVRFYPLFQQAYAELGFPDGYFNDRLVAAIDDLLAAPTAAEPIRLAQPKVLYLFEAEDLEARSAGQKIMMRVGGGNEAKIKAKLREVRAEIASRMAKH